MLEKTIIYNRLQNFRTKMCFISVTLVVIVSYYGTHINEKIQTLDCKMCHDIKFAFFTPICCQFVTSAYINQLPNNDQRFLISGFWLLF